MLDQKMRSRLVARCWAALHKFAQIHKIKTVPVECGYDEKQRGDGQTEVTVTLRFVLQPPKSST